MPIPLVVGPNMNIHEDQHHPLSLLVTVQAYYYVDSIYSDRGSIVKLVSGHPIIILLEIYTLQNAAFLKFLVFPYKP